MTIWRMRIACYISKATNTHSEYVILTAFFFFTATVTYTTPQYYVHTDIACRGLSDEYLQTSRCAHTHVFHCLDLVGD